MFVHFGVNTFTDRERGDGTEDPAIFAPAHLDARQWARVARAGGFRAMILTAKHHDGFCLWPTKTTTYSVAKSPFRGGRGDVVREFVNACHDEGLRAGLYLSPWDRNNPTYGDSPRYNDLYCDQLTELLTQYGKLCEIWFDGANAEGPNGKKQTYDWPRIWALAKRLQPDAVIFSDAGPDVRWGGNENGSAGDPNWSTVDPAVVPLPGMTGQNLIAALQHGEPYGTVWRPAEADVSIRPGWFYHPAEDARVKTVDELVQLYIRSVGRNSKLLLNVPPTRDGVLHDIDVARVAAFGARLNLLFDSTAYGDARPSFFPAEGAAPRASRAISPKLNWIVTGNRSAQAEVDLGRTVNAAIVRLAEDIANGQAVAHYTVSGADETGDWRVLSSGTTIGYARIDRFQPTLVRRLKVTIDDAAATPDPVSVTVFASP